MHQFDFPGAPVVRRNLPLNLRNSTFLLLRPVTHSNAYQFSLFPHIIDLWNSLPPPIHGCDSLYSFKMFFIATCILSSITQGTIISQHFTCILASCRTVIKKRCCISDYISHLVQFCLYNRWGFTVIIPSLRATREIMAHNSLYMYFLVYSQLHCHYHSTDFTYSKCYCKHLHVYRCVYSNNNKGPIRWDI